MSWVTSISSLGTAIGSLFHKEPPLPPGVAKNESPYECISIRALTTKESIRAFVADPSALERISSIFAGMSARPKANDILAKGSPPKVWRTRYEHALPLVEYLQRKRDRSLVKHHEFARISKGEYLEEAYNIPQKRIVPFLEQTPLHLVIGNLSGGFTHSFPVRENWDKGVCGGISLNFIYLVLKVAAEKELPLSESLLRAVAAEFHEGATDRSVFLTLLQEYPGMIGLFEGKHIKRGAAGVETIPLSHYESGVYRIVTEPREESCAHVMALIVTQSATGEKNLYVFDPNIGLLHLDNEEQFDERVAVYTETENPRACKLTPFTFDPSRPDSSFVHVLRV